jgi:hypothetical protein
MALASNEPSAVVGTTAAPNLVGHGMGGISAHFAFLTSAWRVLPAEEILLEYALGIQSLFSQLVSRY